MARPVLLAHLSDPHIGARWADGDPLAGLTRAIQAIRRLPSRPDAMLVTGDLADSAAPSEYEAARTALAALEVPTYVLPGNHDRRDVLREHFDLPGQPDQPVHYAVDVGPLRLVALDTTRPDEARGELDAERLGRLEAELAAHPDKVTLLAMHHPPISTGVPAWDEICLPADDRAALGDILRRHRQVRRLVAGHVHRTLVADLAGCACLTISSTYVQFRLNFSATQLELMAAPGAIAVHALVHGDLISHVQPVSAYPVD